jgi:DNA repair exonuclease SbcCD ATPase subunit
MTKQEFDEMAALVVRLRKELEHTNQHLVAHIDALTKSNAQCGEYLRRNEQLHSLLQTVSAQRDDLQMAKDDITNALAETTKDLAYSRLAVDTMCARDKRFTSTAALCGAGANETWGTVASPVRLADVGDFIERTAAERDKLRSELVEVRAALAATTEQRDSLKQTLDEWERGDTKPHERVTADDVADHVVPPVLDMCMTCHHCGNALDASVFGPYNVCTTIGCPRTVTNNDDGSDKNPYDGPCHAGILVRHE